MMTDLFQREQQVFDEMTAYLCSLSGAPCDAAKCEALLSEYGRLLRQLRRVTKMSDRTTIELNTSKLDLLDKVHMDPLTGAYNRRYMEESLARILKTLSRSGGKLGILMIDIDFFKKYNDTYGHSMGDDCIKLVAAALRQSLQREDDFVARYGGEEFIAVLPNTDECGLRMMAERMLKGVSSLAIPHEKNDAAAYVTISIGGTTSRVLHSHCCISYIKQADKALYLSKQNGRNRYTFEMLEEDGNNDI